MRLGSVRARLMVWNVAIVALLTVALGLAVSWRTRRELMAGIDRDLAERASRSTGLPGRNPGQVPGPPPNDGPGPDGGYSRQGPDGPPFGGGVIPTPGMRPPQNTDTTPWGPGGPGFQRREFNTDLVFIAQGPSRPRVFDLKGKSTSQFIEDSPWDAGAMRSVAQSGKAMLTDAIWEEEEHRVYTVPMAVQGKHVVVQYATPLAETKRAIAGINQILIAMLPLALFVAGLGGYYLTERALRPVGKIAALADRISGENLSERLPVQGRDEFAQLATTINGSLDRLEQAFRELNEAMVRQERFTADASHELKTPLTAIKAQTSLALSTERGAKEYREALEAVDRSASRMGELIEDLLRLAQSAKGVNGAEFETIGLESILRTAAREAIPDAGPRCDFLIDPNAERVAGSSPQLHRLFANLLSNAARHTPPDGEITVRTYRQEDFVLIEIQDTGEGIAAEHLSHLGERFYRVDSARSRADGGVGLGLAICREIAENHGGQIEFESELGRGTTVRVRLPSAT